MKCVGNSNVTIQVVEYFVDYNSIFNAGVMEWPEWAKYGQFLAESNDCYYAEDVRSDLILASNL